MIEVIKKTLLFFVLVFVQVFLIDQIDLGSYNYYFSPLIFGLVFISIKPGFDIWILLVLAFFMGFSMDLFRGTLGLNISALITVAFFRRSILMLISSRDGFDSSKDLNVVSIGIYRYLFYAGLMLFIHHFWFFVVEDFHFNYLHILFLKAIINTIIALGVLILFQYLILNKK